MHTPDKSARLPVSLRRYAAGIHDHHIRFRWLLRAVPRGAQARTNRLAIGARGSAAEMFNVKTGHLS